MNIQKMEGRELDAKVATEVMGWELVEDPIENNLGGSMFAVKPDGERIWMWYLREHVYSGAIPWQPSTDIAAAMLVVEKFTKDKNFIHLEIDDDTCTCEIWHDPANRSEWEERAAATANTPPLAICRAALMAAEAE